MSQEGVERAKATVEVVRRPLPVHERSTRTVDQRLLLRFPRLAHTSARHLDRLPPSSGLRQAILYRASRLGIEAFHRRDYDVILLSHHTDCEYRPPREMIEAGLVQSCYRGPAGYRELMSDWSHAGELHLEDVELIDLGDRWVLLAWLSLRWHRGADAPFSRTWASVITRERGRTIREEYYWSHAEALEAVGLSE
jgi:hypothetical protein